MNASLSDLEHGLNLAVGSNALVKGSNLSRGHSSELYFRAACRWCRSIAPPRLYGSFLYWRVKTIPLSRRAGQLALIARAPRIGLRIGADDIHL